MKPVLSGNRDVDLKIMSELDDRSLFSFCLSNRQANQLCNLESFWLNRFINKYGREAAEYRPEGRTWKAHYLKVVSDLDRFADDPWQFFYYLEEEDPLLITDDPTDYLFSQDRDETLHNAYWMLNLGKNIVLEYPIDRLGDAVVTRTYQSDDKITPHDLLEHIYQFYREPLTVQEWEQSEDNDFSREDVESGSVAKSDLVEESYFVGLQLLSTPPETPIAYVQLTN